MIHIWGHAKNRCSPRNTIHIFSHPGRGGRGAGGGGGGGGGPPWAPPAPPLFGAGGAGGAGGGSSCSSTSSSSGTTTNVCSGCVKFMFSERFLSKSWAGQWANLPLTIGSLVTSYKSKTFVKLRTIVWCIKNRTNHSSKTLQLNKYETAPNFNHISQNLDCLLI